MKRDTRSAYRARAKATERLVDESVAAVKAEEQARYQEARQAAREAEQTRHRFTRAELEGAAFVRTRLGWHKVMRLNKTTVTVKTPHSWTDRIEFDKVLEVRRGADA